MNTKIKKIKSVILSMLMPGLGQFYNGDISKGVSLFIGFAFATPSLAWLAVHGPSSAVSSLVLLGAFLTLGFYLVSIVDAYLRGNNNSGNGPYSKLHIYLSIIFFGYFFVLEQLVSHTQDHLVQLYTVPSDSMAPNILAGDYIFAAKAVNCPGCKRAIKRGDIATFVYPNNRTTTYIKRVIGLPGDKIELKGTNLFVNGLLLTKGESRDLGSEKLNQLLSEYKVMLEIAESGATYPVLWKKSEIPRDESFTVPFGQVFVLGDNRSNATDSRHFGALPLTDIIGIAKQVLISTHSGFDIHRLGRVLDLN